MFSKPGEIAARYGYASQRLEKGRQQRGRFRNRFLFQRFHRSAAQILRQLIGPERFDNWRHFIQARRHRPPRGSIFVFYAARIVEQNISRLAPRSVRSRLGQLPERPLQRDNRHAPNFRPAQHHGLLSRR